MADVTDCVFRQIINKYGKPDVFFTEFVSADGLAHPVARKKLLIDLKYSKNEHPIVAQLFGGKPENIKSGPARGTGGGFDGLNKNGGGLNCWVEKHCAGTAKVKAPNLGLFEPL